MNRLLLVLYIFAFSQAVNAGPSFIVPSTNAPNNAKEIVEIADPGILLSIGFEGSFFNLGLMSQATDLIVADIDPQVIALTKLNATLLENSQSGSVTSYQNHRLGHADISRYLTPEEYSTWSTLLNGTLDRHWEYDINFVKTTLGYRILNGEYDHLDLYFNQQEQLRHVQKIASSKKVSALQMDMLNIQDVKSLTDQLLLSGKRLSVVEIGNILKYATSIDRTQVHFDHPDPASLLADVLEELSLVLSPNAILIQTGYNGSETTYHGISISYYLSLPKGVRSFYIETLFSEDLRPGMFKGPNDLHKIPDKTFTSFCEARFFW